MDDEKPAPAEKPGLISTLGSLAKLWQLVTVLPLWAKGGAALVGVVAAVVAFFVAPKPPSPLPLKAPFTVSDIYKPGNFMGDGETCQDCVEINAAFSGKSRPGNSKGYCIRISYLKPAGKGFAGVYWAEPAHNWGEVPGRKVLGASRVSFWAAGENGGEVVEFMAGGIRSPGKPFFDSFSATLGQKRLEKEWRRFEIDLKECSLSDVIGAFAWSAAANWNPSPLVFYLDDIRYE